MALKGKTAEYNNFSNKVGLFEASILAINPDLDKLNEIFGEKEDRKDPEYIGEDKEGNRQVRLSFILKDVDSDYKTFLNFYIVDTEHFNKNKDKRVFINNKGVTTYCDKRENLPKWFIEGAEVREAKRNENLLYDFIRSWVQIDTRNDSTAEISFDINKILKGNVKELRDILKTEHNHTILANSIIVTSTKTDDEGNKTTREYANVYSRAFLPGSAIRYFKLGGAMPSFVKKYVKHCQDYIKDFYVLDILKEYDPSENVVSGDEVLKEDEPAY